MQLAHPKWRKVSKVRLCVKYVTCSPQMEESLYDTQLKLKKMCHLIAAQGGILHNAS